MSYWVRITGAIVGSLLLNAALLVLLPHAVRGHVSIAENSPRERAIRLDFRPPEPAPDEAEAAKRLIDPGAAADGPVAETDLISSQDSQAQDNSESEGDESKPAVDELDDFDQIGVQPGAPSEPSPPVPPAPAEAAEPMPSEETQPPAERPAERGPTPVESEQGTVIARAESTPERSEPASPENAEKAIEELTPPKEPEAEPLPERFQVAEASPPSPNLPVQELRTSRGREEGGASQSGFTSFEANRHELGEYMLLVRKAVEREWRSALRLRYTGVSRTEALIACSIRPDGSLEYARIVDAGASLTYAVLCREAIERAAPFGAFPFSVPEIYRKDNLEITWKFSYL